MSLLECGGLFVRWLEFVAISSNLNDLAIIRRPLTLDNVSYKSIIDDDERKPLRAFGLRCLDVWWLELARCPFSVD
jgi:hypothetical protein